MEYLEKMRTIQNYILEFLDNEGEDQNNDDIANILSFQQDKVNIEELKSLMYLISKISKNHHRKPLFFDKIRKILIFLREIIKQSFSNAEIYNFFKKNKIVLLLLIDENILTFDSYILNKISIFKDYFYTEINELTKEDKTIEIPEFYEEKRRKGENDSYLCEIIRNDNIDEFIIYYSKKGISLSKQIESSIYETNSFLQNKKPTLIEYSAFFGSIQIFRFLFQNQVSLTQSLWLYAIHGENPDIIHFLEENQIHPKDETYKECLKESIKCHHNDFAMYFKNNYINEYNTQLNYYENEISYVFRFFNFQFMPTELNEKFCFYYAIEHDHFKLVEYYKNIERLNINEIICQNNNNVIFDYLLQQPGIEIGNSCFKSCKKLTKICIPSSVTSIGKNAFCYCDNLTEITIPSSVTKIGDNAFHSCTSLKELIIPSSVTSIGDGFVSDCSKLSKIMIPMNIENMGKLDFRSLSLTEFTIPSSVTMIDANAFSHCLSLTKIEIPSSVTRIEERAFLYCKSLKEIVIPSSVTFIGVEAFGKCISLTNVIIPSTIKSIEFNAFKECTSLEKITLNPPIENEPFDISVITDISKMNIVIVGCSYIGKSSLCLRYLKNEFKKDMEQTIAVSFYKKNIEKNDHLINVTLWDVSTQDSIMLQAYLRTADCIMAVFDLNSKSSFNELTKLYSYFPAVPSVLIGNKSDLTHSVDDEEIRQLENKYKTKYFEASAKNNSNIEEAFEYAISEAIKFILKDKVRLIDLINAISKEGKKKCNIY